MPMPGQHYGDNRMPLPPGFHTDPPVHCEMFMPGLGVVVVLVLKWLFWGRRERGEEER